MSKIGIQARGSGAVMPQYLAKGGRAGHAHGMSAGKAGRPPTSAKRTPKYQRRKELYRKPADPRGIFFDKRKDGGRIGLKDGSKSKPWGVGPKPGTEEYLMQQLHKPRKRKALGSIIKYAAKKFRKKKVYPETEELTHQTGPYVGDVGSEGKKRKMGPKSGRGKSPGRRPWDRPRVGEGKSIKERREELRKKARKSGGHSKIVFADEWKHIDPGLQKGLFKKEGGRIGLQDGKRVDVPPSSQWKKATGKNLKRGQAEAAIEQYKDRPKKLKFRC